MGKLFIKELKLCLHPAAVLFIFMGAFVCIPNYPYEVMFFFSGLGAFFICLTARENGDAQFTCILPVKKRETAYARMMLCVALQACQLLFATICILLKANLFPMQNYVGMDANVTLISIGFIMLGTFNLIFFPQYFSNPNKVGKPFILASVMLFLFVTADVMLCYLFPPYMLLDTPDTVHLKAKLILLAFAFVYYVCDTVGAFLLSGRAFEKFDL